MKYLLASALAGTVSLSTALAAMPVPLPQPAARLQQEMAQVPPTDPPASDAPALIDAVKGVHPRLLFTQADIDALKAKAASDPMLQKALDGTKEVAGYTPALTGPRPEVVAGDDRGGPYYIKAPALAYMYALEKDPAVKEEIITTLNTMLNVDHWADANNEVDASMGAGQNLFFVALLYDAVYNDLDPGTRSKMAQKLFTMARRMYYLGHKQLELPFPAKGFWQQDPQPNHRWYRDMGLAAAVLAIADEKDIDASYLMQALKEEMDFVAKWYPPQGDCHEGVGYQEYGIVPISSVFTMMDRNLGTTYLKDTGIRNAWEQQLYFWVPGRLSDMSWGDDQNGPGASFGPNDAAFFLGPKLSQDPMAQAAVMLRFNKATSGPKPPTLSWTMLAFYDPSITPSDYKTIPLTKLLPDIGAASMRDSWEDDAVVFTFKCGPSGGYKLNEYRMATPENGKPHGVNIAHDDPDANEFSLAVGNGFAFHPGVYSTSRATAEHTTLTVDGTGQVSEFPSWTPPLNGVDWQQFSYLTGWKTDDKGHAIIEGEAGSAYRGKLEKQDNLPEPLLKTYRRTAIWMPKEYILILDNIAANGVHKITWHANAPVSQVAAGKGTATTETGTPVAFQIASSKDLQYASVPMNLVGRWGTVPIQQIQANTETDAVKLATVIDPWKTGATVKMTPGAGTTTVEVTGTGYDDTWTWNEAKDAKTPSIIDGKRAGAPLISLTEADKAPTE